MNNTYFSKCGKKCKGKMPVIKPDDSSLSSYCSTDLQPTQVSSDGSILTRLNESIALARRERSIGRSCLERIQYSSIQNKNVEGPERGHNDTSTTNKYDIRDTEKPHIVDLCEEDKKRIIQLVDELANFKEEKQELEKDFNKLQKEFSEQNNVINKMEFNHQEKLLELKKGMDTLRSKLRESVAEKEQLKKSTQLQLHMLESKLKEQEVNTKLLREDKREMHAALHKSHQQLEIAMSTIDKLNEKLLSSIKHQRDESSQAPEEISKINHELQMLKPSKSPNCSSPEATSEVTIPKCRSAEPSTTTAMGRPCCRQDHTLLSELFFMSSALPAHMETIFFVKPPKTLNSELELVAEPFRTTIVP